MTRSRDIAQAQATVAEWVRLLVPGLVPQPDRQLTDKARTAVVRTYHCAPAQAEAALAALDEVWRAVLLRLAADHVGLRDAALRQPSTWRDHGLANLLDGTATAPEAPRGWAEAGHVAVAGDEEWLTQLHHAVYPKAVRHAAGAYYTPRWLAQRIVADLNEPADVLDPSCGAGVFLLTAIERWWPDLPPAEQLARVAGLELDPLAVLAAKVNLLLRLPSGPPDEPLHLPIYRADAVLDPPPFDRRFGAAVGNPPWVFWNHLDPDYRARLREAMEEHGLIATGQGTMRRLGAACKDLSMLFVHVSAARYLADGGELAFVMPGTALQSTAGHEFRKLTLPDGGRLAWHSVDDWTSAAPFVGAANQPVVIRLRKGMPTRWPVAYRRWRRRADGYEAEELLARPSDPGDEASFWSISETAAAPHSDNATLWPSRVGIDTKLEGLFRVEALSQGDHGVRIRNVTRFIKQPVPELEAEVEPDLLYPVVTGRDLLPRWGVRPTCCYLLPHTAETAQRPLPEDVMVREYPLSLAYLARFRERLEQRSIHRRWGQGQPWYAVYNIGPYSFAPWRVVWKSSGTQFGATVINTFDHPILGGRPLLASKSVILLPFDHPGPACFVCGLLNSTVARERIAAGVRGWVHRQALNLVPPIPDFDMQDPLSLRISILAERCHKLTAAGEDCGEVEAELDEQAGRLWAL